MKFKKIMLVTFLLLAVLTIGAVCASEEGVSDNMTVDEPVDESLDLSVDDGDLLADDEEPNDDDYEDIEDYEPEIGSVTVTSPVLDMYGDQNSTIIKGDSNNYIKMKVYNENYGQIRYTLKIDGNPVENYSNAVLGEGEYSYNLNSLGLGDHTWNATYTYIDYDEDDYEFYDIDSPTYTYSGTFTMSYYKLELPEDVITSDMEIGAYFAKDAGGRLIISINGNPEYNKPLQADAGEDYIYCYEWFETERYGTYRYNITYTGGKYSSFTKLGEVLYTYVFSVELETDGGIDDYTIRYGTNVTGTISLPNDVENNVSVTLNGKSYTVKPVTGEDSDGETSFSFDNVVVGENTMTFTYADSKYSKRTVNRTFFAYPSFEVPGSEVLLGDMAEIELILPKNATGYVYIYKIEEDEEYNEYEETILNQTLVDGKFSYVFDTTILKDYGKWHIKYVGDDYVVNPAETDVKVIPKMTVPDKMWTGDKKDIVVELGNNINGHLTVTAVNMDSEASIVLFDGMAKGTQKIQTSKLGAGSYAIDWNYEEEDVYQYDSYRDPSFEITADEPTFTIEVEQEQEKVPRFSENNYIFNYIEAPYDGNGYFLIYIDGKLLENRTCEQVDGPCGYVENVAIGKHNWEVKYTGDSYYKSSSVKGTVTVTYFNIQEEFTNNEMIEIMLPENATGYVSTTIDGKAYDLQYVDATYSVYVPLNRLSLGEHSYQIRYSGDENNLGETATGSFNLEAFFDDDIDEDNPYEYGTFTATVTVPKDATGYLWICVDDGDYKRLTIKNGKATYSDPNLAIMEHSIEISSDDESCPKYPDFYLYKLFTISEQFSIKSDVYGSMEYGEDAYISLTVPDSESGNLIVTINRKDYSKALYKGKASYSLKNLAPGYYNITARFYGTCPVDSINIGDDDGDGNYGEFIVYPKVTSPDSVSLGGNATYSIDVQQGLSGNFTVQVKKYWENESGSGYDIVDTIPVSYENGKATFTLSNVTFASDELEYVLHYDGNESIPDRELQNPDVSVPMDIPKDLSNGAVAEMTLEFPDDANGTVTVNITRGEEVVESITVEVENGKAVVPVPKLDTGVSELQISYSGNYGNFTTFKYVEVELKKFDPKITNVKFSKTTTSFDIAVPAGVTGKMIVLVDKYAVEKTISNSKVSVSFDNLAYGKRTVLITYSGDVNYARFSSQKSVTVPYPKITSKTKSVVTNFGKYSVTVYGIDGKVVAGTNVVFKINGKKIGSAKTNKKGVASIVIKKAPKSYTITAEALKVKMSKKVKVKSALTIKTSKIKKSAKNLVIKVTLKNGKKAIKGKKITIKFKGKKYKVKTNKKGLAKVTIKKAVLKNLKVGKKVKIQAIYLKDTVKKSVKVKK